MAEQPLARDMSSDRGLSPLQRLQQAGRLGEVDVAFAELIARRWGGGEPAVSLAVALASRASRDGHVCLDLRLTAGERLIADPVLGTLIAPEAREWEQALRACGAVGRPGEPRPLVLDAAGRLYLARYWRDEQRLAVMLAARAGQTPQSPDSGRLRRELDALFPPVSGEPDWQRVAAAVTVLRGLSVIAGGPGTGKTATVARILVLLLRLAGGRHPRMALAAPTGKAASRLEQAVAMALASLPLAAAERAALPLRAHTLHRLLGGRPGGGRFRHHADNPLALDLLVVDEASMVDLALMTRLLEALPSPARLVLLGDRDQLASVQAGAVLGDVCAGARGFRPALAKRLEELAGPLAWRATAAAPALSDCLVPLQRSYRYDAAGGLGRLAVAVRDGDAGAALAALDAGEQVGWGEAGSPGLAAGYQAYRAAVRGGQPPEAVLAAFDRYRVLAALRAGPRGVEALNRSIEQALGLARERRPGSEWYAGRPVMITRNHYGLGLYNGDVGVALADAAAGGELRVFFQQPGAGLRALPPLRLPEHETVYATTVHKSQGSELEAVAVVLPEQPGAAATRELLYTAITRARSAVRVWASRQALAAAVAQPTRRSSGLREALWGDER